MKEEYLREMMSTADRYIHSRFYARSLTKSFLRFFFFSVIVATIVSEIAAELTLENFFQSKSMRRKLNECSNSFVA